MLSRRSATQSVSTKPVAAQTASKPADDASVPVATAKELSEYRKKLAAAIKAGYKPPKYDLDTNTKVSIRLTIDSDGQLTGLEMDPNPDDNFNQALQRALDSLKPIPAPPKTKSGKYALTIRAHAND